MKLYRIVSYVLNINGDSPSIQRVKENIECNRYPEFHSVMDIKESDCGDFDDDHHLNKSSKTIAEYDRYFPEVLPLNTDENLRKEISNLRTALLRERESNEKLNLKNEELKLKIVSLEKVQEFVKTIGGMIK